MTDTRTDATLTWVCPCCLMKLANDDTSGCEYSCDTNTPSADHPVRWLEEYPDDVDLTIGMLWSEHDEECPNYLADNNSSTNYHEQVECTCETRDFSSTPCAGCGSHLAGSRHAVTMWTTPEGAS